MKITMKDIKRLQKELKNAEGKRRIFIMATINRYSEILGAGIRYEY